MRVSEFICTASLGQVSVQSWYLRWYSTETLLRWECLRSQAILREVAWLERRIGHPTLFVGRETLPWRGKRGVRACDSGSRSELFALFAMLTRLVIAKLGSSLASLGKETGDAPKASARTA